MILYPSCYDRLDLSVIPVPFFIRVDSFDAFADDDIPVEHFKGVKPLIVIIWTLLGNLLLGLNELEVAEPPVITDSFISEP